MIRQFSMFCLISDPLMIAVNNNNLDNLQSITELSP